jgi:hypothetical protein
MSHRVQCVGRVQMVLVDDRFHLRHVVLVEGVEGLGLDHGEGGVGKGGDECLAGDEVIVVG